MQFDVQWRENEARMVTDIVEQAVAMLQAAGATDIQQRVLPAAPGRGIHEMGGACMGEDPTQSVVNRWNQLHVAPNVFVTDGAAMSSGSCVNPTLTFMAMTARAVDHAIRPGQERRDLARIATYHFRRPAIGDPEKLAAVVAVRTVCAVIHLLLPDFLVVPFRRSIPRHFRPLLAAAVIADDRVDECESRNTLLDRRVVEE